MKLIPESLVADLQMIINNAIHSRHTWAQVAEIKRMLIALKDAPEPPNAEVKGERQEAVEEGGRDPC